ncbi:MAG: DUF421 domain-containing protein [Nocardioides sp.]
MWHDLTHLDISLLDKVIRTIAVYLGLAVVLRVVGKRDLAQLNSFDLIVVLLLSNVVQNAVIGPDNSLLGGLIGAAVLVAVNAVVVRAVRRNRNAGVAWLVEGGGTVIAEAGRWLPDALTREGIRRTDADAALRRQNAYKIEDVKQVRLEPGGTLVVSLRPELESATHADIERIEAKLDRLLAN